MRTAQGLAKVGIDVLRAGGHLEGEHPQRFL